MINSHVLPKVFAVSIPEGGGLDSNQQHPDLYELLLKSRAGFIDLALCQLSCHRQNICCFLCLQESEFPIKRKRPPIPKESAVLLSSEQICIRICSVRYAVRIK